MVGTVDTPHVRKPHLPFMMISENRMLVMYIISAQVTIGQVVRGYENVVGSQFDG